ncbi:MAG TPA: hypothetical protein VMV72_10460 [Verrucomicrobiae bacterium]|nr:hypothetical protein [Verrucomicrobiae bacterium]
MIFGIQENLFLAGHDSFSNWADVQRDARVAVFKTGRLLAGNRASFGINQMQTAGLVWADRPAWARGAEIAFFNQPGLGANNVRTFPTIRDE